MKEKHEQKGITLIALVVTIIVLLILAGISINALAGNNGILNKATEAKISQEIAQVEEMGRIRLQAAYTENLGVVDDATAKTAVIAELTNNGYEVKDISTSNETVKGLLIQDSSGSNINEVGVVQGKSVTIKVALDTDGDTSTKTYVKIEGKYYELDVTGLNVNVSRQEYKEVPNEEGGYQIKLTPPSSGIEMTAGGTKITKETAITAGAGIIVKATGDAGTFKFNVKETKTSVTRDVNVVVSVNEAYATGLSIKVKDNGSTEVEAGKTVKLEATKTPTTSTDTVSWSIKSGSATVDAQGTVTINSDATAGSTVIVAAKLVRADGTTSSVGEKTITLTVKAKVAGAEAITTGYGTSVAAANAKDLIGAQVTNYNDGNDDGEGSGWQVFYIGTEPGGTEERIYLISTDYIKLRNYPDASDGTSFASGVKENNGTNYAKKYTPEITKIASLRKTISDRSIANSLKIASNESHGKYDKFVWNISDPGNPYSDCVGSWSDDVYTGRRNWECIGEYTEDGSGNSYYDYHDTIELEANGQYSEDGYSINLTEAAAGKWVDIYEPQDGFSNVCSKYAGSSYINSDSKAKKWISWANQYSSSTNDNISSVSYMLDTNVWTSKYGDNNFADYVIGGPTLEMFVASWNTKHPESKIYCDGTGSNSKYGYYVGRTSGSTDQLTNIGTSDSTYVKTSEDKANAFWLASPSANNISTYRVMAVYYDGYVAYDYFVHGNTYYGGNNGFRPLVCLSSDVKLVSNGNGTYKLQK